MATLNHPFSYKFIYGIKAIFICFFAVLSGYITFSQDVYFEWAKRLDRTTGGWEGYSIGVDEQKNVYITGEFRNTVDLDPGPAVYNVSAYWDRVFVVKLDPAGNFIWGRTLDGERFIECSYFHVTPGGDIYLTGLFSGTTDFDPGPGTYELTAQYTPGTENHDLFTAKLDKDGNFKWAHSAGNLGSDWSHCVTADVSGNVYSTGYFTGVADFDPSSASYGLGSNGLVWTFITKFDSQGNFVWAKQLAGYSHNRGFVVRADLAGNVYVSGKFEGEVDFDPGGAVYNLGSISNTGTSYIVKLDANGNFLWARENIGGSDFEVDANQEIITVDGNAGFNGVLSRYNINGELLWTRITGGRPCSNPGGSSPIKLDPAGNIFLTGEFYNTNDFDPGPGTYFMTPMGGSEADAFISRLDPDGSFVWAKQFGNFFHETPTTIALDTSGNVYTIGAYFYTVDFDPGPGVFNIETNAGGGIFIHKMSRCQNITYSAIDITSCSAYTLNNHTYTQSGTYIQTIPNLSGCDSIITVRLTLQNSMNNISAEACDTYEWNNQLLNASGAYTQTFTSVGGCDSVVQLQLLIRNKSFSSIDVTICEGDQYAGYTTTGTYIDVLTAANGCDSVRTLKLQVNEKKYSSVAENICDGQSYLGYTLGGIYVDLLRTVHGCDSIRTLTLEVNPVYSFSINKTICEGETYMGHGASGTYTDRMQTVTGCDSIQTTILTVLRKPNPILGNDTSLCRTDSLILHAGTAQNYSWQDGSSEEYYIVRTPGLYSVVAANSCGTTEARIFVEENSCIAYFPNAFTPNKDGKNDNFGILQASNITEYHLTVFNRWGQLIFQSKNPGRGWDGTFNGQGLETNVFVWQCSFKERDMPRHMKGSVVLLK
jgi:gliding motility-associated-like protein